LKIQQNRSPPISPNSRNMASSCLDDLTSAEG
jgi:hypothetical protein